MPGRDILLVPPQPDQSRHSTWIHPDTWSQHEDFIKGLHAVDVVVERMCDVLARQRDFRPSPLQLTRQLALWFPTQDQQPDRSYSDKEAVTSVPVHYATTARPNANPQSSAAHQRNHSSHSIDSFRNGPTARYSYNSYESGYQSSERPISRLGTEDGRYENKSVLSWTVDTRSEANSLHPSRNSIQSLPANQHGATEDTIFNILLSELSVAKPRSDSYLRLARDTLGIPQIEMWTSDRLLEFAILLSKGGLTSFGASLYNYLLFRECENPHSQQFVVKLLVRCLISGQKDISWSRLGRLTYRVIDYCIRHSAESSSSMRFAEVLSACLISSPVRFSEDAKDRLLTMAYQAMDADNWKGVMRKDVVDLKDFLDLEARLLNSESTDHYPSDGFSGSSGNIWQKGSFQVRVTDSGRLHIRKILEWALLRSEGSDFYRRVGEYSKRGKEKQMYQATYLSLVTRLVHEAGTHRGPDDIHLVVNIRDSIFKLNEYESIAIISLLLVNIKRTMSLSRNDSDETFSSISLNPFFNNLQLLEDTLRLTLGKYFSTRDAASSASRDGADEFVLNLVRRAAGQQRQWADVFAFRPTRGGQQGEMLSRDEPDIVVTPNAPHAWHGVRVELPTRTMTRR